MITVSTPNLKSVIKQIERRKKQIKENSQTLTKELADKGNDMLAERLSTAVYAGDMYAEVMATQKEENGVSIGIKGESVTFIEFGTGTFYPDNHPLMDEFGFARGEFGKKLGANPPWFFRNESGELITTLGNEANRVVYNTGKELRKEVEEVAKEVFRK